MRPTGPTTVISFAFGAEYYHRAAVLLRGDCERLGVDHHIVDADLPPGTSWIDACRYKTRFIAECHLRLGRPLWWVDVDCRLMRELPRFGADVDLAFFLRGFRDFRQFDPVALPRTMQPSILYFGHTPLSRQFIDLMTAIEAGHQGSATDDWFLQEAWSRLPTAPAAVVMPPSWVQLEDQRVATAVFDFGRSGHAAEFKGQAEQHSVELFSPQRRKALFMREVSHALRDGSAAEAKFFLRKAQQADPDDESLAYRVARGWAREGKPDEAERVLSQLPATARGLDHVRRFRLDFALDAGDDRSAARLAAELAGSSSEADRIWAIGRGMRIALAERARRARLKDAERPQLWWMESPYPGNFGDILNPYVVERLTGLPPLFGPKGAGTLAIGSTIRFARDGANVWGAGTPRLSDRLNPRAKYLAVRGPLTARLVTQSGGQPTDVFGDPAALLPRLYEPRAATGRRHSLGVVLHHAHEGKLRVEGDVKVITVLRAGYEGIEAFIDEVCQCERILSSSLHGLIVSHAYGIPAQWFTIHDSIHAIPGDGTKFHDYLLSVGLGTLDPLILLADDVVRPTMSTSESLPRSAIDLDRLLDVAPWQLGRGIRR
jgi:Polysaccharide pyruvyl transferase/Tetratricopeptide repeat